MNPQHSEYLLAQRPRLKALIESLSPHYDTLSVLATDSVGKAYVVRTRSMDMRDAMGERGLVFRAVKDGRIAELSLNGFDPADPEAQKQLKTALEEAFALQEGFIPLGVRLEPEEDWTLDHTGSYDLPFTQMDDEAKLAFLKEIVGDIGSADTRIVNTIVQLTQVTVRKLFLSKHRDLLQSYPWSQAAILAFAKGDAGIRMTYSSVSGMKGLELLEELKGIVPRTLKQLDETLKAEPVEPGEYEIICTPDITGLIAHEAFGHGVEMDMFVKNRAQAPEFLNKPVASTLVGMHDGAAGPKQVSSYAFDDEGNPAYDTTIILNGILKQGIADALSAARLGTHPTGNGKRESFERKAYTRMTSTYFTPGNDSLEAMIRSVKKGYLLDGMESGMEDPKNWGIQCVLSRGYEIVKGEFTGKIVGPVILTGHVIDLLKSVSMVSGDFELSGSGFCGKGHKEWVKTANGGPYIKAKARLG